MVEFLDFKSLARGVEVAALVSASSLLLNHGDLRN